jgi:hypothetical protein
MDQGGEHSADPSERRDFVLAQYERLWTGVKTKAESLLTDGERDLSRVHLFMRRNFGPEFDSQLLKEKYQDHERQKAKSGFIYDKQIIDVNDADTRVITLMTDAVKMRAAIDAFGPKVERIIELGSGWGKNLFNLFRFGAPLATEFIALELTETGREITRTVAAQAAPTMRLTTRAFDYYEPDFGFLTENKPTAVFTHHSIEQIPEVSPRLIDAILSIPGFTKCVHLEPCGFQIPTNNWLANGNAGLMQSIDARNKRFAEKRNQNKNLYPLLRQYEQQGRISIHAVCKYFTSHLMENGTTLIVWGPPGAANTGAGHDNTRRDDLRASVAEKPNQRFKSLWGSAKRRLIG